MKFKLKLLQKSSGNSIGTAMCVGDQYHIRWWTIHSNNGLQLCLIITPHRPAGTQNGNLWKHTHTQFKLMKPNLKWNVLCTIQILTTQGKNLQWFFFFSILVFGALCANKWIIWHTEKWKRYTHFFKPKFWWNVESVKATKNLPKPIFTIINARTHTQCFFEINFWNYFKVIFKVYFVFTFNW